MQVSSVRESRSDDKRFSIFTGTKRLHLRAETREDRATWVEALLAIKDMFPRMSNSELMAPIDNLAMSTEKLRQRLVDEGVSELAIQDCEQIMRSEFSALQSQLVLLKQKQWLLIDTLRHLEVRISFYLCCFFRNRYFICFSLYLCLNLQTEKVDLENTVVDESQRHTENEGPNDLRNEKFSGEFSSVLFSSLAFNYFIYLLLDFVHVSSQKGLPLNLMMRMNEVMQKRMRKTTLFLIHVTFFLQVLSRAVVLAFVPLRFLLMMMALGQKMILILPSSLLDSTIRASKGGRVYLILLKKRKVLAFGQ